MNNGHVSKYVLLDDETFRQRINKAKEKLLSCNLCPRQCGVNRTEGRSGYCRSGAMAEISHWQIHYGEEPPLSGNGGAGTIFFAHCNMRCVYCQNFQISQRIEKDNQVDIPELARIMLELQKQNAQNIDLVSPTHFMPMIIEAVYLARKQGLRIPLVYNTNGYELDACLELLDGIIDIYLPDLKYDSEDAARAYSDASDYVYYAKQAIKTMYGQAGGLLLGQDQQALSGLIIRHLVLPEDISSSRQVIDFIKDNTSTDIGLSLMSQYAPCYMAAEHKRLNRRLYKKEYDGLVDYVLELGFDNCWIQNLESNDVYFPDFDQDQVF